MGKLLGLFIWLKKRIKEPSTHASLAIVCQALKIEVDFVMIDHYLNLATIAFGALGFFLKEKGPETVVE
jgi:hypothetical protein